MRQAELGLSDARARPASRLLARLPSSRPTRALRRRFDPARKIALQLRRETAELSAEVFARIERDEEFWRDLTEPEGEPESRPEPADGK
jgi:hypothetical protein